MLADTVLVMSLRRGTRFDLDTIVAPFALQQAQGRTEGLG